MASRFTLADWIKEALNDTEKGGPCTALSCVHVIASSSGNSFQEVHSVKIGGGRSYSEIELGDLFRHKARMYAQELPGVQSFVMLAFYNNDTEPKARHPFRENGETQFSGLATEGPDEGGRVAQGMRLTEVIVQGSFKQNAITFDTLLRVTDVLSRQNITLMQQNETLFNINRELAVANTQQNHEMRIKETDRQMVERLLSFAPPLINSLTGTEVFPKATADSSLLEGLVQACIDGKVDIAKLASTVPENLWPLFAGRMEEIAKEIKAKKAKELTPVNPPPTNPPPAKDPEAAE